MNRSIEITAVWLRREDGDVIVDVEIDGKWHVAIREHVNSNYSHIAEGNGADNWPLDAVLNQHGPACTCDACMERDERLFTVWHDEQEQRNGE